MKSILQDAARRDEVLGLLQKLISVCKQEKARLAAEGAKRERNIRICNRVIAVSLTVGVLLSIYALLRM